ncbi:MULTISPECIES: helix-turn-helix transcriptional regulator [Actinosynnema]|uniref:helix-turn-helix domain-containing protein n=1 Tax=Actinosynnema TaxID=40566 RepID=UPI0020A57823|nr:helix-turn-helix transcriptional regulator [Actinosynnema pretiosum]MCP2097314.1 Transcriptional regulator, contains XRE-family HTH domain [Actinosynnema pretiosum]
MTESGMTLGDKIKWLRAAQGLGQKVVADQAGCGQGTLSKLERGRLASPGRALLENVARALSVQVEDLVDRPWQRDPNPAARAGLIAVETALEAYELGDDPGGEVRPWLAIQADLDALVQMRHVHADYVAQGRLVPGLLRELHAAYVRLPARRTEVLVGLIGVLSSAAWVCKRVGGPARGWTAIAVREVRRCAQELEQPQWLGYAAWLRADGIGAANRGAQYEHVVASVDRLSAAMDDGEVTEMVGMLHLSAALASASSGNRDGAETHLAEAAALAGRQGGTGTFGHLWFGPANVGIWTTSIELELGEIGAALRAARGVDLSTIPSANRAAEFQIEVGRTLIKAGRPQQGLERLLAAEQLAPQRLRHDVLAREAIAGSGRAMVRSALGRDMRSLVRRMGMELPRIG